MTNSPLDERVDESSANENLDALDVDDEVAQTPAIIVDIFDGNELDDTDASKRLCRLKGGVEVLGKPRMETLEEVAKLLEISIEKYAVPTLSGESTTAFVSLRAMDGVSPLCPYRRQGRRRSAIRDIALRRWYRMDRPACRRLLLRRCDGFDLSGRASCAKRVRTIEVPDDFPRTTPAALSGFQPKLPVRRINGMYVSGQTAEERAERYNICEDLAHQLIPVARKDELSRKGQQRAQTLKRLRVGVQRKRWVDADELDWLIKRVAQLLEKS
jgi:hypothetical protein